MPHPPGPDHIQIAAGYAIGQMPAVFNGCCMVAILSKGPGAMFPRVEFLRRLAGNQLKGAGNNIVLVAIAAPMREMPDVAGKVIAAGSGHGCLIYDVFGL